MSPRGLGVLQFVDPLLSKFGSEWIKVLVTGWVYPENRDLNGKSDIKRFWK